MNLSETFSAESHMPESNSENHSVFYQNSLKSVQFLTLEALVKHAFSCGVVDRAFEDVIMLSDESMNFTETALFFFSMLSYVRSLHQAILFISHQ